MINTPNVVYCGILMAAKTSLIHEIMARYIKYMI